MRQRQRLAALRTAAKQFKTKNREPDPSLPRRRAHAQRKCRACMKCVEAGTHTLSRRAAQATRTTGALPAHMLSLIRLALTITNPTPAAPHLGTPAAAAADARRAAGADAIALRRRAAQQPAHARRGVLLRRLAGGAALRVTWAPARDAARQRGRVEACRGGRGAAAVGMLRPRAASRRPARPPPLLPLPVTR